MSPDVPIWHVGTREKTLPARNQTLLVVVITLDLLYGRNRSWRAIWARFADVVLVEFSR